MTRLLLAVPLLWLLGCGEDPPLPSGDPAQVTYVQSLGVDLGAMQRLDSGLYLQDKSAGTGAEAVRGRPVTVHYTGWLPNGTQFDSSRGRNPFSFTPGRGDVIAGWEQGVPGMKVGGVRRLILPSALGYGDRSVGAIPPRSVLIFDVELISIP
ncbi:FKBP-type peptidyl-prolyl cis-trans isomerase [Stigmatella sp. ncwal1]|uniref:Peptidyl-prolyl cis-trans isomerase n=1 Tax=Stigmatella ashevillensis TaxID=2995309 RepID=A0ABT5DJB8_9BACT|nr:FKBP-type peptidyl-prolyl cis-trans isomerase [Stigmatella ashevillena]MDC0712456.1 FKBP-type peptidyl-prolyl cis-trans isomerase [Stigmatella ashevillena]